MEGRVGRQEGGDLALLAAVQRQALTVYHGDNSDDEPQGGGIDGVPQRLLRGSYTRRAEDDERARGAGVQKLGEQDAFRVGVNPRDQYAHGGQGGSEGEKKGKPVGGVGSGGSQVIDDGDVPSSPEQAEQDCRS